MSKKYTEEEIFMISEELIGKSFGKIKNVDVKSFEENVDEHEEVMKKAYFGHILETDVFGMNINSYSRPDFEDAGIELKVTPYKKNRDNTLSAKERLVLNIIDYMTEYQNTFASSHFLSKNSKIQIIWYLWEKDKKKSDFKITHQYLYSFPNDDLEIIKNDWEIIINKIKDGKAHELSEADTMYLGACTKGANKNSVRKQPFSDIMAMQRAFCFKNSYMTGLVRKHIGNYSNVEKVLKDSNNIDELLTSITNKYKGKSQDELMKEFNIETEAKHVLNMIINRMFNVKSNLRETDEFIKAKIIPKTIRVEENGSIKESMSFPYFKFIDVANTEFEDSEFREELETTKYMFSVFKKENGKYIFKGIKLWNMPQIVINKEVKDVYDKTREVILSGNIVSNIDNQGRRTTNFPGMSFNCVCHVRPHGRDSKDVDKLPVKEKLLGINEYTKQCFWINNTYVKKIIDELL